MNRKRSRVRAFGIAAVCAGALLAASAAPASATILLSAFPNLVTDPASVGQTNLPGSIVIANDSTAPNDDPSVEIDEIRFTPSCGVFTTPPCPSPEPGVITVSPTATGAAGSACAGINFPFAVTDNATGEILVDPLPGTLPLPSGSDCRINFTYSIVKSPAIDSQPGETGTQTDQILEVTFFHPDSFGPVDALGSDFTTINPAAVANPTPTPAAPAPAPKPKCKKKKKGKKQGVAAAKCKKKRKK